HRTHGRECDGVSGRLAGSERSRPGARVRKRSRPPPELRTGDGTGLPDRAQDEKRIALENAPASGRWQAEACPTTETGAYRRLDLARRVFRQFGSGWRRHRGPPFGGLLG